MWYTLHRDDGVSVEGRDPTVTTGSMAGEQMRQKWHDFLRYVEHRCVTKNMNELHLLVNAYIDSDHRAFVEFASTGIHCVAIFPSELTFQWNITAATDLFSGRDLTPVVGWHPRWSFGELLQRHILVRNIGTLDAWFHDFYTDDGDLVTEENFLEPGAADREIAIIPAFPGGAQRPVGRPAFGPVNAPGHRRRGVGAEAANPP